MFDKNDIESLKRKLELKVGKTIILRYNDSKKRASNKGLVTTYIIEDVCKNVLVLRKVINENIGVLESYTFVEILSGSVEIIDMT